jgi:hypothetical protein
MIKSVKYAKTRHFTPQNPTLNPTLNNFKHDTRQPDHEYRYTRITFEHKSRTKQGHGRRGHGPLIGLPDDRLHVQKPGAVLGPSRALKRKNKSFDFFMIKRYIQLEPE